MLPTEKEILSLKMHDYAQQYCSGKLRYEDGLQALAFCRNALRIFDRNKASLPNDIAKIHDSVMQATRLPDYDFMVHVLSKCCAYRC